MTPSILRNHAILLVVCLLNAPVIAVEQGLPIDVLLDESDVFATTETVTMYVFDAQEGEWPVTAHTFYPGEWASHREENGRIRLTLQFAQTEWIRHGQTLWGEFEVDGIAVGERIRLAAPELSVKADGGIKTATGFVFPDDSVQTTAGVISETDPTVNALGKASLSCSHDEIPHRSGSDWVCTPLDSSGDCSVGRVCAGGHTHSQSSTAVAPGCYVRKESFDLAAGPGASGSAYVNCASGKRAVSCGSYTADKDVITTMSGYFPDDVNGASIPSRCLIAWRNDLVTIQVVYGFATCCD